jgi:hypothetical protein
MLERPDSPRSEFRLVYAKMLATVEVDRRDRRF